MVSTTAQYFLNHNLDLAEIEWQVQEMAKAGYRAIYPHARQGLRTPYMSESWWQVIDKIMEVCRLNNMELWLWDEDYFPSGLAGGRVVWDEPGFIARNLDFHLTSVEGYGPFEVDFPQGMLLEAFAIPKTAGKIGTQINITRYCGTRRQGWTERRVAHGAYSPLVNPIGNPHWRCNMIDNRFALHWQPEQAGEYIVVGVLLANNKGVHPDLLCPEAVRKFISLSYEKYFQRYEKEFGKIIKGAFTDEPSPGGGLYPWTTSFPNEFYKDHGYDILEHLPHLALDLDQRSAVVRHHYRLTQHRLQSLNYVQQIAVWCKEHSIKMAGHLTRTEWFSLVSAWWPNELRCYQFMDIPTTDPLGAGCGWKEAASYHSGIKVASSAAHLFQRIQAGSDALAVIGDEAVIRDLKYQLDYQMVLGINHFSMHGLSYSLDGPRKDEVPPSLFYQHNQWKQMPVLLDYIDKVCNELTGGVHLCEIAVLYPSTSLACQIKPDINWKNLDDEKLIHNLTEFLLSNQRDFDYIDEVTLQENVNEFGEITTPEKYQYLLLPYLRYIDSCTANALLRFINAGGTIIAIGKIPVALTHDLNKPVMNWADMTAIYFFENADNSLLELLPGPMIRGQGKEDIFILERQKDDGKRTFIFNRREKEFEGEIRGIPVRIPPCGSVLLKTTLDTEKVICLPEMVGFIESEVIADLSTGWTVQFESNQIPLNFWHATSSIDGLAEPFNAPGFDLMRREIDPVSNIGQSTKYYCRFMFLGEVKDAKLVVEDSGILGNWKLFVNDIQIEDWESKRVFDCANKVADISHAVRGGSTPTLNVVKVETTGPERGLKELPYFCGAFTCEYRYSHDSYPFIKSANNSILLKNLLPWDVIGYPTFSGTAIYQREFELTESLDLWLDLGRVEDIAVVYLDGRLVNTLAWPPYRCSLGKLLAGKHQLTIRAINATANRTRAARLPSGLLGPVRLLENC